MDYNKFAEQIKKKYPQYNKVDNYTLASKIVKKYPVYKEKVSFPPGDISDLAPRKSYDKDAFGELNQVKAAVHGIGQGVTFGFMDEILGGLRSIGPGTYSEEVKKIRDYEDALREKYPKTDIVSDIVGGLAPALLTGGSSLAGKAGYGTLKGAMKTGGREAAKKVLKNQALKNIAKTGAAVAGEGAIAGIGYGDVGSAEEAGAAAKRGAGMGLATFGALKGLGKIGKSASKAGKYLGKKALSTFGRVDDKALERGFKRPSLFDKAPEIREVANKVSRSLDDLDTLRSKQSGEAFRYLEKTGKEIPKKDIIKKIDDQIDYISKRATGDDKNKAIKELNKIKGEIISDPTSLRREIDVSQPGTEFNPEKMRIQNQIDELSQLKKQGDLLGEKEALETMIESDPVRDLVKYQSRKTGELPEVDFGATTKFGKKGDEIAQELGFDDSESLRLAYKNYRNNVNRLKNIKQELDFPYKEIKRLRNELSELDKAKIGDFGIDDTLPVEKLKSYVQDLDKITKWDNPVVSGSSLFGLKATRRGLDEFLKTDEQYSRLMGKQEALMKQLKDMRKDYKTVDALETQLKKMARDDIYNPKQESEILESKVLRGRKTDKLRRLNQFLGEKFDNELKDAWAYDQFFKSAIRGSKGVTQGAALGGSIGGGIGALTGLGWAPGFVIGAGLGGTGGAFSDVYGTRLSKHAVKSFSKLDRLIKKSVNMGKYDRVLQKAKNRGSASLAVTHYLLYTNDPEYKKYFDNKDINDTKKSPYREIPTNEEYAVYR